MRPWDAAFLAAAALLLGPRPKAWWLLAALPPLAFALRPLGGWAAPVAALAGCVLAFRPRAADAPAAPVTLAAAALLLTAPSYAGWLDAARHAAVWLAATALLLSLEERFLDASPRLRGAPIRLFAAGVLYYAFLPAAYA